MLMHGDRRSTMGHSEVVGDDDIAFKPVMHVKSPCARKMIVQLVPQRHERVVRIADDATSKADIEVQRRVAGGGMADDERVLYAGGNVSRAPKLVFIALIFTVFSARGSRGMRETSGTDDSPLSFIQISPLLPLRPASSIRCPS
jgi:hypothetical protein